MWTRPVLAPFETIDLAAAITKKNVCQAAEQVAYVKKRHPEVAEIFGDFNELSQTGQGLGLNFPSYGCHLHRTFQSKRVRLELSLPGQKL